MDNKPVAKTEDEKLTDKEIDSIDVVDITDILEAQIEKSRAYQSQQTGDKDLEQKIRDILDIWEESEKPWIATLSRPPLVLALSTLLSQELKGRDEKWMKSMNILLKPSDIEARLKEHKNAREFARGAIGDAIYLEDGLDGGAGQIVINMITEVLDDKDEYESTFKDGE